MNNEAVGIAIMVAESMRVRECLAHVEVNALKNLTTAKESLLHLAYVPESMRRFSVSLCTAHVEFFQTILTEIQERIAEQNETHKRLLHDYEQFNRHT